MLSRHFNKDLKASKPTGATFELFIAGSEALKDSVVLPLTLNYECQFFGMINLGICLPNYILIM